MKPVKTKDGYIKFDCRWKEARPIPAGRLKTINYWRKKLYALGMIGSDKKGIGFGNISQRIGRTDMFIITGSATGKFKKLNNKHYTRVTGYDFKKNSLNCQGPVRVSSESLSHAAVYKSNKNANCVIHIHNQKLWKKLKNRVPATSPKAAYGTPAMAREIEKLFKQTDVKDKNIFVMAGHRYGLVAFGPDAASAGKVIIMANRGLYF
ncbi:MAG: class II aldolase/adducin family protein [Patescibacteria group bacterium]|jgi:ribulose-5-phosphate 4-epimerase/fuculose-1-phosphate aldolase